MEPSSNPQDDGPEPANLRFLRRLVTVLTVVMIGGCVLVVGLLVIRFQSPPAPPLPETLSLPDGLTATAVTYGDGWYAVVTTTHQILIFDAVTGALRQTVQLK